MLVGGFRFGKGVLQNRTDIQDALTACRAGARENHLAHEIRLLLRDDLRDETAEREAQQVDLAETERAHERDGVLGHRLDCVRSRASGCTDAAIVEYDHMMLRRQAV